MFKHPLCILLSLLPVFAVVPAEAHQAAATQPAKSRFDREMTVSPARAEDALRAEQRDVFAFSQDALPVRNENAAPLYLQGFPLTARRLANDWKKALDDLERKSIHELDVAAARKVFGQPGTGVEIAEPAVRRTWADWGSPIQELGISTLLPHLSDGRTMARAMAMEARLLALEGKYGEAADMLRRLYVFGQHFGNARQPVLIEGLVGVGIAALATDAAAQIAELEDAPNRYWALTTLPTPMVDVSRWLQSERTFLTASFPALREPELMTALRWGQTMMQLQTMATESAPTTNPMKRAAEAFAGTMQATEYLKSRGYTQEQIEKTDLFPTAARLMVEEYFATFDDFAKLAHLPFPEAYPRLMAFEQRLAEENAWPVAGVRSLPAILLPTLSRGVEAPYRLERQIAALRIVEAIRDHAAEHGRLPATLAELRLPVPEDPMTGETFGYAVEGDRFTLTGRRYSESDVHSGLEWRVTMRL